MACITLLSDFGLQDATVASVKGLLAKHTDHLQVIDISHHVEPYHLQQAAYLLNAAYGSFPTGSYHLVLCDVFYTQNPQMVLCEKDGHFFLAPDNGVLPLSFSTNDATWQCATLQQGQTLQDWIIAAAQIIDAIRSNNGDASALDYEPKQMNNLLMHWQPKLTGNTLDCHVMHIDRFENVVVNLTKEEFEKHRRGRAFRIQFVRHTITEISNTYADVKQDDMLCRFNSVGYLEIAINRGKAASLLGLKLSKEQHLVYNAIKIIFE
ncbi:hypothetical protein CAP35_06055 [Chitinophagaceae bacterium IBVUCB1]|nr:hypothetical protein CAP35_06055 [Chitinophagaceae bacterium IBVUCB1]